MHTDKCTGTGVKRAREEEVMRPNPPKTLGSERSVTLQIGNHEPLETPRMRLIDSDIED